MSDEAVRRSLRCSVYDGMAWAVMNGAGERYIAPLVVFGGSGLYALAAISQLPALAGALVQCHAANVADRAGHRRRMFVGGAVAQALMWLPAAAAAVMAPGGWAYWVMLSSYVLMLAFHNFTIPPWQSVMGDLVPEERRGRYFGARNFAVGVGTAAAFFAGGWWVTHCHQIADLSVGGVHDRALGFVTLFLVAGIARLVSAGFLAKMHEPEYVRAPSDRFSILDFLRRAPHGDFGRFVAYSGLLHLGVGFAGPFFTWYVLKGLHYSTFEYASLWTVHLIAYWGLQPFWGKLADRVGNKRILAIGGIGIAGIPALWLASDSYVYLLVVQAYDGFVWSAFNIAGANYLFDIVTPPKRARCTAYRELFLATGALVGAFAGAVAGETLAPMLPLSHPFALLLIGSTVLRLLPSVLLLRTFREARLNGAAAQSAGA